MEEQVDSAPCCCGDSLVCPAAVGLLLSVTLRTRSGCAQWYFSLPCGTKRQLEESCKMLKTFTTFIYALIQRRYWQYLFDIVLLWLWEYLKYRGELKKKKKKQGGHADLFISFSLGF